MTREKHETKERIQTKQMRGEKDKIEKSDKTKNL